MSNSSIIASTTYLASILQRPLIRDDRTYPPEEPMTKILETTGKDARPQTAAFGPIPPKIGNWIDGQERLAAGGEDFPKLNPADGRELLRAARSRKADVEAAVAAARKAQPAWAAQTPVAR